MIKFLLGIAIIAFTTFCGYLLGKKYRKRKEFYMQFFLFNERFLNEITYYRRPLREFIGKYTYKNEFSLLLERFIDCADKRLPLKGNLLQGADFDCIKAESKSIVEDYFIMLGRGDSVSQKTYFCSMKETLAGMEKEAIDTAKKYGDLYIKLGFLCGLLVLILIL